jgi:hypothetical protein
MGSVSLKIEGKLESIREHPAEWGSFVHHAWHVLKTDGHLPKTRMWDYLEHRRELDPSRFDKHHPCLAKLFRYEDTHPLANIPVKPVIIPLPSASIPEPPVSVLLLSGLIMMAGIRLVWRK